MTADGIAALELLLALEGMSHQERRDWFTRTAWPHLLAEIEGYGPAEAEQVHGIASAALRGLTTHIDTDDLVTIATATLRAGLERGHTEHCSCRDTEALGLRLGAIAFIWRALGECE